MSTLLLATKLYIPPPPPRPVARPRLLQSLTAATSRPLTLLSAPAGFGKTTLLSQWIDERKLPVAWISLDEGDNDLARFLAYMIAALQTIQSHIGQVTQTLLQLPQLPPLEALLTPLVNEIAAIPQHSILVLDDLHRVENASVHSALAFLLDHLPPQMHLIISSRAEPLLPLSRLRARGHLTELRAEDLRLAPEEAAAFLSDTMGLNLSAQQVTALEARTEGWIAGLQMAALSLQGQKDISSFIQAFTGSHRYIVDYLLEEVLRQQPEAVRTFLLRTCILERLSAPLCDALNERQDGADMLDALERANLFVIPLDNERRWYRYHHLFADVLRNRLQHASLGQIPALHRAASRWYEQNGFISDAVNHALFAQDFESMARLIDQDGLVLATRGQSQLVLRWLDALPETLVLARPKLCLLHASVLAFGNQFGAARARAQDAARVSPTDGSITSKALLGFANVVLSALSLASGDLARGVAYSREALELLPQANALERASAAGQFARAYLLDGNVTPAAESLVAGLAAEAQSSGSLIGIVSCFTNLGRLYVLQGKLHKAAATYARLERSMPAAEVLPNLFHGAGYYFGLGEVLLEWNQLEAAERYQAQGLDLVRESLMVYADVVTLGYLTEARLCRAHGDPNRALGTLDEFEHLTRERHFFAGLILKTAAARARILLLQGDLSSAARWAEGCGLRADDPELPYGSESGYLTLARVLMAQGKTAEALALLNRLLQLAEAGARLGSAIEILMLRALALQAQGDTSEALIVLERVLALAEPQGYVRIFLDEGEPMIHLLRHAASRGIAPHPASQYVSQLLSEFNPLRTQSVILTPNQQLIEPLTDRELQVLRLVADGCSNQEIAAQLVVALGTVKTHINNIYGKLNVQTRTQAVARARELNLLV